MLLEYRALTDLIDRDVRLVREIERIVYLDEVLTMSTRLGVVTADERWRERYLAHEPQLAEVIALTRDMLPTEAGREALTRTEAANTTLVELELEAFDLVAAGDGDRARELVFGDRYEGLKSEYKGGVERLQTEIRAQHAERLRDARSVMVVSSAAVGVGLIAAIAIGVYTSRAQHQEATLREELFTLARRGTMSELASGLAHEINQPLAAIGNYCATVGALVRSEPFDRAAAGRAVDAAREEITRAGDIVENMRSFARDSPPEMALLDIAHAVRGAVMLVRSEVRRRGVTIRVGGPSSPVLVRTDRVRVQQVLVNLLLNAADACEHVEGPQVEVEWGSVGGFVELLVSDNGPGVAEGDRGRVFEAFFSTKAHGMGIGLSLSRTLAESIGGRLVCRGNNDGSPGSAFVLLLPLS